MYHRFGDGRFPSTNIRMDQFREHLQYLDDAGYSVVPLARLVDALTNGSSLPERAVVITIDDAYLSVYDNAAPLLKKFGYPYTVFVATDGVDEGLVDFMTWEQMRELQAGGASFANHGASHESVIDRSPPGDYDNYLDWVRADMEKGRRRLREELEPYEGAFAYPYGEFNLEVARLVGRLGYEVAFGQHSGAIGPLTDRLSAPRYPMNETYGTLSEFRTKVSSLPLPVEKVSPEDPEIETRLPLVEFTLAGGIDSDYSGLACYVGGSPVTIDWQTPNKRFSVGPEKPLSPGRNRINCTAPAGEGRFYWFSHPWFVVR